MIKNKLLSGNKKINTSRLWSDSPCSYNYVSTDFSIDNIQRFKIGSIYDKDDVTKSKKVFSILQRPDLLLKNFRREIKQVNNSFRHKTQRASFYKTKNKSNSKTNRSFVSTASKFYTNRPKNTEVGSRKVASISTMQGTERPKIQKLQIDFNTSDKRQEVSTRPTTSNNYRQVKKPRLKTENATRSRPITPTQRAYDKLSVARLKDFEKNRQLFFKIYEKYNQTNRNIPKSDYFLLL